jgi:hypothetical protein
MSINNHCEHGTEGDRIASALSKSSSTSGKIFDLSLKEMPACGTNTEILRHHCLDSESITNFMAEKMGLMQ